MRAGAEQTLTDETTSAAAATAAAPAIFSAVAAAASAAASVDSVTEISPRVGDDRICPDVDPHVSADGRDLMEPVRRK